MPQPNSLIAIVAASLDEAEQLRPAAEVLDALDCPYEARIASLWTGAAGLLQWAAQAEVRGVRVLIAAAGDEPALPGMLAAAGQLPVIAVPVATDAADADVMTALEMSSGVPVALACSADPRQAALLAVRIIATGERRWRAALESFRHIAAADIEEQNEQLHDQWGGETAISAVDPMSEVFSADREDDDVPVYTLPETGRGRMGDDEGAEALRDESGEAFRIRSADELNRPLSGQPRALVPEPEDEPPTALPPRPSAAPRRLGRLRIDVDSPDVATIEEVVDCLLEGGVVAFPTETVYGLAADATNPAAVERLFSMKGRERTKAISLMVDSSKMLAGIAQNVTTEIRRLMEAFWPGPLTMIFQKRPVNFRHVSPGETIGVRLPDHSVPLAIMQALARPIACTSANLAGEPEARSGDEIDALFGDRLDALLDGGLLPERPASTVLDVSREPYRILRQGAINRGQLAAVVGEKLEAES